MSGSVIRRIIIVSLAVAIIVGFSRCLFPAFGFGVSYIVTVVASPTVVGVASVVVLVIAVVSVVFGTIIVVVVLVCRSIVAVGFGVILYDQTVHVAVADAVTFCAA